MKIAAPLTVIWLILNKKSESLLKHCPVLDILRKSTILYHLILGYLHNQLVFGSLRVFLATSCINYDELS